MGWPVFTGGRCLLQHSHLQLSNRVNASDGRSKHSIHASSSRVGAPLACAEQGRTHSEAVQHLNNNHHRPQNDRSEQGGLLLDNTSNGSSDAWQTQAVLAAPPPSVTRDTPSLQLTPIPLSFLSDGAASSAAGQGYSQGHSLSTEQTQWQRVHHFVTVPPRHMQAFSCPTQEANTHHFQPSIGNDGDVVFAAGSQAAEMQGVHVAGFTATDYLADPSLDPASRLAVVASTSYEQPRLPQHWQRRRRRSGVPRQYADPAGHAAAGGALPASQGSVSQSQQQRPDPVSSSSSSSTSSQSNGHSVKHPQQHGQTPMLPPWPWSCMGPHIIMGDSKEARTLTINISHTLDWKELAILLNPYIPPRQSEVYSQLPHGPDGPMPSMCMGPCMHLNAKHVAAALQHLVLLLRCIHPQARPAAEVHGQIGDGRPGSRGRGANSSSVGGGQSLLPRSSDSSSGKPDSRGSKSRGNTSIHGQSSGSNGNGSADSFARYPSLPVHEREQLTAFVLQLLDAARPLYSSCMGSSPRELASIAWALSQLPLEPLGKQLKPVFIRLMEASCKRFHEFDALALSTLLHAVVEVGMTGLRPDWARAYCLALQREAKGLTPQGIALVLHAFAKLHVTPQAKVVGTLINLLLPSMRAQAVDVGAAAAVTPAVAAAASARSGSSGQQPAILSSHAPRQAADTSADTALVSAAATCVPTKHPAVRPCDVTVSLWALAKMHASVRPTVLDAAESWGGPQLALLCEKDLCNLLWAFARLQHRPSSRWQQQLQAALPQQLPLLGPRALATVLHAVAEMRVVLPPGVVQTALESAAQRFDSFTLQGLAMLVSAAAGMQHHPGTAWLDAFHAHVSAQPAQLDEVFVERVRDAFRRLDYHPEEKQGQKQGPQQHQLQRPGLRRAIPLPIIPARSTQPGLAVQQPSRARLSQEAVGPSSASSSSSSAASVCSHAVVGASLGAGGNGLSSTLQQAGVLYAARLDHADVSMSTSAAGSIASSTSSSTAATARATHQHGGGSVAGAGVQDTAAPAHSGKAQLAEEHPYSNSGFHAHASGWLHSATGSMDAADIAWACGEMVGEDSHAWMVPGQWDFEAASLAHVHAVSEEQVAVLAKPSRFGP